MSIAELREQLLFLHNDSVTPHHHQPMPSDKVAGQHNTKPLWVLNHNTTLDIWVAGFGRIRPGKGTEALICGVHFWTNFGRWGGWWAIVKSQTVGWIRSVSSVEIFKHTTINHQVAGFWLNRPGDEKAALFCGCENLTKNWRLGGGVSYSQIASSGPNLISPPSQSIQIHHNQPNSG
jgi:hypothetical protein